MYGEGGPDVQHIWTSPILGLEDEKKLAWIWTIWHFSLHCICCITANASAKYLVDNLFKHYPAWNEGRIWNFCHWSKHQKISGYADESGLWCWSPIWWKWMNAGVEAWWMQTNLESTCVCVFAHVIQHSLVHACIHSVDNTVLSCVLFFSRLHFIARITLHFKTK